MLRSSGWLDRRTIVMIVELTLFNSQSNLFTSVKLLAERSPTGVLFTDIKVTSTQLFRYITGLDNILLACEVRFFPQGSVCGFFCYFHFIGSQK